MNTVWLNILTTATSLIGIVAAYFFSKWQNERNFKTEMRKVIADSDRTMDGSFTVPIEAMLFVGDGPALTAEVREFFVQKCRALGVSFDWDIKHENSGVVRVIWQSALPVPKSGMDPYLAYRPQFPRSVSS